MNNALSYSDLTVKGAARYDLTSTYVVSFAASVLDNITNSSPLESKSTIWRNH